MKLSQNLYYILPLCTSCFTFLFDMYFRFPIAKHGHCHYMFTYDVTYRSFWITFDRTSYSSLHITVKQYIATHGHYGRRGYHLVSSLPTIPLVFICFIYSTLCLFFILYKNDVRSDFLIFVYI